MKAISKFLAVSTAALAFSIGSAQAESFDTISLDGVVVPVGVEALAAGSVVVDFGSGINLQTLAGVGNIAIFGSVGQISRSVASASFGSPSWNTQDNNVELTYELSVTNVASVDLSAINAGLVTISLGLDITYYIDSIVSGTQFNPLSKASATDGEIWLTGSLQAPATFTVLLASGGSILADDLLFDVTGGKFETNFDSNTGDSGADLITFSVLANNGVLAFNGQDGTLGGRLSGNTSTQFQAIPEPASLGLLGLGLLGIGAARRRKAA